MPAPSSQPLVPSPWPLVPSPQSPDSENCNKTYGLSQLLTSINYDDFVKCWSVFYTLLNK